MKTKQQVGFTLMEILVSSVLFVIISGSLLSLFNYVLKINRRTEVLRQASQGVRNFMEFLVKEIRNGQVDYYVANGDTYIGAVNNSVTSACVPPGTPGGAADADPTYTSRDNKLGILNSENIQECFYYGDSNGVYVNSPPGSVPTIFASPTGSTLVLEKTGVSSPQILNPSNIVVDQLMFLIRPLKDPYIDDGGLVEVQPMVAIVAKFIVRLPTGEQLPIYYQTSVSTTKYDLPKE